MYEELMNRLKNLATLEVKNGESVLHVTAEATAAIREIAQEAADTINCLMYMVMQFENELGIYDELPLVDQRGVPKEGEDNV